MNCLCACGRKQATRLFDKLCPPEFISGGRSLNFS
nr:MAG TPA: hypothetical protein [Caudoviricetes sp.]